MMITHTGFNMRAKPQVSCCRVYGVGSDLADTRSCLLVSLGDSMILRVGCGSQIEPCVEGLGFGIGV